MRMWKNHQFHDIFSDWLYLIVSWMTGSSEPVFCYYNKNRAAAPVDYLSTFATAPCHNSYIESRITVFYKYNRLQMLPLAQ